MTPIERPYKDKEITIRDRETVKLSELTKDERDIYFAGEREGGESATNVGAVTCFLIIALGVVFIIMAYYGGLSTGIKNCK